MSSLIHVKQSCFSVSSKGISSCLEDKDDVLNAENPVLDYDKKMYCSVIYSSLLRTRFFCVFPRRDFTGPHSF